MHTGIEPSAVRQANVLTPVDWSTLPVASVRVDSCVYPCHDLDPAHHHPAPDAAVAVGPIHVEALIDGSFFVHDGRHRLIRRAAAGHSMIDARIYPSI